MALDLTPEKALIFRIAHRDNVEWVLDHGIHCSNSTTKCSYYIQIGDPGLIDSRSRRNLPTPPGGMLNDYAPFYFTSVSPMLYNIKTGFRNVRQRPMEEIVVFVSSLRRIHEIGLPFIFSDRHASLITARFSSDLADLSWIDWPKLCAKDFRKNPEHPDWFEQYQAEALVRQVLPVNALIALVCYNDEAKHTLTKMVTSKGLTLRVVKAPEYYC